MSTDDKLTPKKEALIREQALFDYDKQVLINEIDRLRAQREAPTAYAPAELNAQDRELRENVIRVLGRICILPEKFADEHILPLIQRHAALLVGGAYEAAAHALSVISIAGEPENSHTARMKAIRALTPADAALALAERDNEVAAAAARLANFENCEELQAIDAELVRLGLARPRLEDEVTSVCCRVHNAIERAKREERERCAIAAEHAADGIVFTAEGAGIYRAALDRAAKKIRALASPERGEGETR